MSIWRTPLKKKEVIIWNTPFNNYKYFQLYAIFMNKPKIPKAWLKIQSKIIKIKKRPSLIYFFY